MRQFVIAIQLAICFSAFAARAQDSVLDYYPLPKDAVILGASPSSSGLGPIYGGTYEIATLVCATLPPEDLVICSYTVQPCPGERTLKPARVDGKLDVVGIDGFDAVGLPVTSLDTLSQIESNMVQISLTIEANGKQSFGPFPGNPDVGFTLGGPAGTPTIPFPFDEPPTVLFASMEFRDIDGVSLTNNRPIEISLVDFFQSEPEKTWNGRLAIIFKSFNGQPIPFQSIFQVELKVIYEGILMPPLFGDINLDQKVNLLDVAPFVQLLFDFSYQVEGDFNLDGVLDLLDVAPMVDRILKGCD